MTIFNPALASSEPDPSLLKKLAWARHVSLILVFIVALTTLTAWFVPPLGRILPNGWGLMTAETSFAALISAISLWIAEPAQSKRMHRLSVLLGAFVALLSLSVFIEFAFHPPTSVKPPLFFDHTYSALLSGRMSPQSAASFLLLGCVIIIIRAQKRFAVHFADLVIFCLGLLVLSIVAGYAFGALRIFGLSATIGTSPQSLFCLLLLTPVALFLRAQHGVFSILLGRGIGGKIARLISPILLVLPFLREALRAYFISAGRIPTQYTTALLASITAMLSFALLLFICWRINSMEMKIHDLSLRDELTGLYNLRGFSLLAGQALRMANRSGLPFSVLFIDLDNLKQINDSIGHSAGSSFLVDTAEILKASFRETDVLGRIGGDEFAVASQFSSSAISLATLRLREALELRNSQSRHKQTLSLSIGHVTTQENVQESLHDLLTRADKAMYEEKRRKKPRDVFSSI